MKEYDALRELFSQAESSVQSIFNFYLTLISTVGGAVVVILQFNGLLNTVQKGLVISGLLLFVTVIGSVYLSSITGRYAHMARYSRGVDEIRRFLLHLTGNMRPAIYDRFLAPVGQQKRTTAQLAINLTLWIYPTGTYQLFVAAVNSLSLGAAVGVVLLITSVTHYAPLQSILVCVAIIVVSFVIYNVYSRLVMNALVERLNIRLDTTNEAPFITGKQ